ncbi:MATE family efflux transporter [Candidatus Izemoplasma sp. B36]|uniref:MATE family efflux transporter n=1 Tax=Candidatus Izemoplasma sp. B36 TaxID=3242468 RepID=UPI003556F5A1
MKTNNQKINMLKNDSIKKVLLKLGIPTMIGMMVSALYSVVDAYFVGWLGTSQIGAITVVFPIVQVIIGLGMMFGSGAASYISRLLGENKNKDASKVASTALITSLIVGAVIIILSLCFLKTILIKLGATSTILPYATQYAFIYVSGAILNIFNVTMNNIMTSEGKAKITMIAMFLGCGLNIILDPIFIGVFNMGIQGAGFATVIAQIVTTSMYLYIIIRKKSFLRFSPKLFKPTKKTYQEILKVGVPILVFQVLASTVMGLSNNAASIYGDSAVAAVGVVTRILTLGSYVVFGFMKGFQPVAGFNFGAKQYDRLNKAIKLAFKWSTIFCSMMAIILVLFPSSIISIFSKNDLTFIEVGTKLIRANAYIFPFFGFQMVYMSLFLAMGKGKDGGLLSISRQGIFFIPLILVLPNIIGLNGVIWAQPIADALTVLLTLLFAMKVKREINILKLRKLDLVSEMSY